MKFDPARFHALPKATGFQADNLEKLLRLRELLTEFHKHPFLRDKLVLKGGTALNLFYLDLARLSVDIDLNYIAHIDREEMLRERPDIVKALAEHFLDRKSTRLNSSHTVISYAVFCLKKITET